MAPTGYTVTLSSWREAVALADKMVSWLFRGHANAAWNLQTSLERLMTRYRVPAQGARHVEANIIEAFQRSAHQYLNVLPTDDLEWLALIQHHGGPTRLLDFTESFYVAAYFAVEDALTDAAIWAINRPFLLTRLRGNHDHSTMQKMVREAAHDCIEEAKQRGVLPVTPWRLSSRNVIQQGYFLFPAEITSTFEANLCASLGVPDLTTFVANVGEPDALARTLCTAPNILVVKIILPQPVLTEALDDLRKMNVSAATLFPGLDGFTQSLRYYVQSFVDADEVVFDPRRFSEGARGDQR